MAKLNYSNQTQRRKDAKVTERRNPWAIFRWEPLQFGKYNGWTLPEIAMLDTSYFYWLIDSVKLGASLKEQAALVARRLQHIRPWPGANNEYEFRIVFDGAGRFSCFDLVEVGEAKKPGSISTAHLNASIIRLFNYEDRKRVASSIRRFLITNYLDGEGPLWRACQTFIEDDKNFDLMCGKSHLRILKK